MNETFEIVIYFFLLILFLVALFLFFLMIYYSHKIKKHITGKHSVFLSLFMPFIFLKDEHLDEKGVRYKRALINTYVYFVLVLGFSFWLIFDSKNMVREVSNMGDVDIEFFKKE